MPKQNEYAEYVEIIILSLLSIHKCPLYINSN